MKQELLPVEYNVTDSALAEIRDKYAGIKVTDPASYEMARKGIAETRSLRVAVEEERKSLKAGALDYGRRVDAEAKRITAALLEIEEPLKAEKQKVDDEKARIQAEKIAKEQARVEGIRAKIEKIRSIPLSIPGKSSADLGIMLDNLGVVPIDEAYQEFQEEAQLVKQEAMDKLRTAHAVQAKIEKEDAERKAEAERLERIRKEQETEAARQAEERRKIEEDKAKIEKEKRAEQERKDREEFERQAREKAEADARAKIEREAKEKAEHEKKEAARKAAKETRRPDKEKLISWANGILDLVPPVLADSTAQGIADSTIRKIHTLAHEAIGEAEKL